MLKALLEQLNKYPGQKWEMNITNTTFDLHIECPSGKIGELLAPCEETESGNTDYYMTGGVGSLRGGMCGRG